MYNELAKFRKEQGLENTPGNIVANILKETAELEIEISNNNVLGMICELCDHVIYAINAIEATGHDAKSNIERSRDLVAVNPDSIVYPLLLSIADYTISKNIAHLVSVAIVALKGIDMLGYKADACVLEKAKCINSRKGSHNKESGKWEKDPIQPKSELYKPQYNKCKRG